MPFTPSDPARMGTLGSVVFTRTYARKVDGEDRTESWEETLSRCVEACNDQLGCGFTAGEQQRFFDLLHQNKCSLAGRFMWQLGTDTVNKFGLLSLQNCAFVAVDEPVRPFTWAMDCLMLGCGVGFSVKNEHVSKLPEVQKATITRRDEKDSDFIVPDSREGWVALLGKVLKAHFYGTGGFTYSCQLLREKGAAIKSFGGVASGPGALCDGVESINKLLNEHAGEKPSSTLCLDVMNIIGRIVVSGNVRRSAEIAIGDADDVGFLAAKRWDLGGVPNWRAFSNNSVYCANVDDLPDEFWEGYLGNGEPYGLINIDLSKKCGRLEDGDAYPDPKAEGFNPCGECCREFSFVRALTSLQPNRRWPTLKLVVWPRSSCPTWSPLKSSARFCATCTGPASIRLRCLATTGRRRSSCTRICVWVSA